MLGVNPFATLSLYEWPLSKRPTGVILESNQVNSVCSGTSDCRKIVDFSGSSPRAK